MELWDAAFCSVGKPMFVVETKVLTLAVQKPIIGCESEPFSSTTHPQKSFPIIQLRVFF